MSSGLSKTSSNATGCERGFGAEVVLMVGESENRSKSGLSGSDLVVAVVVNRSSFSVVAAKRSLSIEILAALVGDVPNIPTSLFMLLSRIFCRLLGSGGLVRRAEDESESVLAASESEELVPPDGFLVGRLLPPGPLARF